MNESENKVNLAEIARLHAVNDRLRAEIERWRAKSFNPVTLTDAEREAIGSMAHWCEVDSGYCREADDQAAADHYAARAATLRGLLERTVEK